MFSCAGPRAPLKEGLGLCIISLDLESRFDAEEFECGGDGVGVEVEGSCNRLAFAGTGTDNGWYRSTVVGSVGVWKVIRLALWSTVARGCSVAIDPGRLLRYQRNTQIRMKRRPAHAPTTMPPMAPPSSLDKSKSA